MELQWPSVSDNSDYIYLWDQGFRKGNERPTYALLGMAHFTFSTAFRFVLTKHSQVRSI